MTRKQRVHYNGAVYHVTARGNNRQVIFKGREGGQALRFASKDAEGSENMGQLTDEIRQEQLAWACRRLEALDKMEAKLREMRTLAEYAASRILNETEATQVQEWVNILQAEVGAIDRESACMQGVRHCEFLTKN